MMHPLITNAPIEEAKDSSPLKLFYGYQKQLIDLYIGKGVSLPPYPLDVNIKSSQSFIKELIYFIVEELTETHEAYRKLMANYEEAPDDLSPTDWAMSNNILALDLIEETSDIYHFINEILVYLNMDMGLIRVKLKNDAQDLGMLEDGLGDALTVENVTKFARYVSTNKIKPSSIFARRVLIDIPVTKTSTSGIKSKNYKISLNFDGGTQIQTQLAFLDCINSFVNIGRLLKKKKWREGQVDTDIDMLHLVAYKAFISFFDLIENLGIDYQSFMQACLTKQNINRSRIEQEYK